MARARTRQREEKRKRPREYHWVETTGGRREKNEQKSCRHRRGGARFRFSIFNSTMAGEWSKTRVRAEEIKQGNAKCYFLRSYPLFSCDSTSSAIYSPLLQFTVAIYPSKRARHSVLSKVFLSSNSLLAFYFKVNCYEFSWKTIFISPVSERDAVPLQRRYCIIVLWGKKLNRRNKRKPATNVA